MLLLLSESVASRMRELVSRCTVVEVYIRDANLTSFTRRKTLRAPTCSSLESKRQTGIKKDLPFGRS